MKRVLIGLFFLFFALMSLPAQVLVEEPSTKYQNDEWGFQIAIAEQGMGFGGYYFKNIANDKYLGVNIAAYKMRDKYEYTSYYLYSYGYYSMNRYNNLYLFPLYLEYKRHFKTEIFANDVRPYFFVQGGGIFAMNFPENADTFFEPADDFDPEKDLKNEYEFGYSFGLGMSMDFSTKSKTYFSLRPVYNWIYFPNAIAGKQWHSTLEFKLIIGLRK